MPCFCHYPSAPIVPPQPLRCCRHLDAAMLSTCANCGGSESTSARFQCSTAVLCAACITSIRRSGATVLFVPSIAAILPPRCHYLFVVGLERMFSPVWRRRVFLFYYFLFSCLYRLHVPACSAACYSCVDIKCLLCVRHCVPASFMTQYNRRICVTRIFPPMCHRVCTALCRPALLSTRFRFVSSTCEDRTYKMKSSTVGGIGKPPLTDTRTYPLFGSFTRHTKHTAQCPYRHTDESTIPKYSFMIKKVIDSFKNHLIYHEHRTVRSGIRPRSVHCANPPPETWSHLSPLGAPRTRCDVDGHKT